MTKIICNVYKDFEHWVKPPPGIGDYIRGCAYLARLQAEGRYRGRFEARVNLDLAPASRWLNRTRHWQVADPKVLAATDEFFLTDRDGDVEARIAEFLDSDAETLFVSTNRSWSALEDTPPKAYLDPIRRVFDCDDGFDAQARSLKQSIGPSYVLLHVRDEDRTTTQYGLISDPAAYRARVDAVLDSDPTLSACPPERVLCISNNVELRHDICRARGFVDPATPVENTGFRGTLAAGKLSDLLMIRDAAAIVSITPFQWDSGFSVWAARLFGVPARFVNADTPLAAARRGWHWPRLWRKTG